MIDINELLHQPEQSLFDDSFDPQIDPTEDKEPQTFPATVIIDSREQAPFHFLNIDPWPVVPTITAGLKTGDYSMLRYEHRIAIERKSISDFLGSITAGRERFEREFERLAEMEFAAVVVEGEFSEVLEYSRDRTNVSSKSILGTLDSWRIRYGVHWVFCLGRRGAEINTLTMLNQFLKNDERKKKQERIDRVQEMVAGELFS